MSNYLVPRRSRGTVPALRERDAGAFIRHSHAGVWEQGQKLSFLPLEIILAFSYTIKANFWLLTDGQKLSFYSVGTHILSGEQLMNIDIGINEKHRAEIANGLAKLLADSYTLYLKTHNFHWNVKGPMFQTLHLMFETQYTELALAVDLIAERIRALGFPAPGTYAEFSRLSSIQEAPGVPKAEEMIKLLIEGQEASNSRSV